MSTPQIAPFERAGPSLVERVRTATGNLLRPDRAQRDAARHPLPQLGPDGFAPFKLAERPRRILIALDSPFESVELVRRALGTLRPAGTRVQLLWVDEQPRWINRALNRGLVMENLRFSRQRAIARLEAAVNDLEERGFEAGWEAEVTAAPAERIARAARQSRADLIVVADSLIERLAGPRGLEALSARVGLPVMVVGPGDQIDTFAGAGVPTAAALLASSPAPAQPSEWQQTRHALAGRSRRF